jgi:hypothetical protein
MGYYTRSTEVLGRNMPPVMVFAPGQPRRYNKIESCSKRARSRRQRGWDMFFGKEVKKHRPMRGNMSAYRPGRKIKDFHFFFVISGIAF